MEELANENLNLIPCWFSFKPIGVNLNLPSGEFPPSLQYRVQLKHKDIFTRPNWEENLKMGDLRVLTPTDDLNTNDRNAIGYMSYFAADDSHEFGSSRAFYDINVKVPKNKFDELVVLARQGVLPDIEIGVKSEGMRLEGDYIWDTSNFPTLDVTEIDFTVTLVTPVDGNKGYDQVIPPTRVQLSDTVKRLDSMNTDVINAFGSVSSQCADLSVKLDRIVVAANRIFWVILFFGVIYLLRVF
jgi:hypothetical protein